MSDDLVERLREWREVPYFQPDLTADEPEELMAEAAAEIDRLRADLATIATHWPGKWTRQCVECEIDWPCQPALDAVTPYMDDDAEDGTEVEAAAEIEQLRAAMQDAITEIGAVHREATGLPWCVTCGTADGSWPCASSVTGDELRRALDGTS